jgi:arsenite methyltransferase
MLNRSNRLMITKAVEMLALRPGAVVADVGFGGGLGLALLLDRVGPDGHVEGIDISSDMIRRASRQFRSQVTDGRLSLMEGSLTELPLANNSLDGAITINTVYFIPDLEPAFVEMRRVLKNGGAAVVGIGDPDTMSRLPMVPYGFRIRAVEDVVASARSVGLTLSEHARSASNPKAAYLLVFTR